MRVFVCEYVTGGGLRGEALPESLVREASLMRDAMVRDVSALPGVTRALLTTDDRLGIDGCVIDGLVPAEPPTDGLARRGLARRGLAQCGLARGSLGHNGLVADNLAADTLAIHHPAVSGAIPVGPGDDAFAIWQRLAEEADVIWPVAPETGGVLERLVRMLEATGRPVAASRPEAIAAAASKHETARRLAVAGLPHIPTFPAAEAPDLPGPRVTKPDDGAGCDDTRLWPAGTRPEPAPGHVVQPYVAGEAASLTVLARGDGVRLLSVNRQHMAIADGRFRLAGLTVAALDDADGTLARLAGRVAAAFPGLRGVFGIDLVLTTDGPVVVEVNPRLTTAYAGLRAALGFNPATLLEEFAGAAPLLRSGRRVPQHLVLDPVPA